MLELDPTELDATKITEAGRTLLLYDAKGELIAGVYGSENRLPVPLSEIAPSVVDARISTEDTRFFTHNGIDVKRIFGALAANIKTGSLSQGGSTITQQLIKLSHLTPEKTFARKLREAKLAMQLERLYTKEQILEMYLNYVYFGRGAYGIQAAAETYFGKNASELDTAESALLIGVLKAPSRYAPHLDLKASVTRRNLVLSNMQKNGALTPDEAAAAKREEPALQLRDVSEYPHGYYVEYAIQCAANELGIGKEELLSGGYRLYTALNTELQNAAEGFYADDTLFPEKEAQSAFVSLDVVNGTVEAMIGGRGPCAKLGLNRAVQVKRQPGSAIKPVAVYAPALELYGYTAATTLIDEPTDFSGYTPRNFGGKYYGRVTLRTAVEKSLNVPAVTVLRDIGVVSGVSFANKLGIELDPRDNTLALALGGLTYGVTPLELANAYCAFASGGEYVRCSPVLRITDAGGSTVYRYEKKPVRVMSRQNAYILTSLLEGVVKNGTGKRLDIGIPAACKTGTSGSGDSDGNRDAWAAAYNPEHAAVVWLGYDDMTRLLDGSVTGGTFPASMLARIFESIYPEKDNAPEFFVPFGVRQAKLDRRSLEQGRLKLASGLTPSSSIVSEYFTQATTPYETTDYWVAPRPPLDAAVIANGYGEPVVTFTPPQDFALYRIYRQFGFSATLIAEYPGGSPVTCTDINAPKNARLYYYITPVHPEKAGSGAEITGASTARMPFTRQ